MTINEANERVRGLIGEDDYHCSDGVLAGYYDTAQKQIASTVAPVEKRMTATCGVVTELPADAYRIASVDKGYRRLDQRHILPEGEGEATVVYYAYPRDITESTAGDASFEVEESVQSAIPYFAAAYAVLADSDMRRYHAFLDMYQMILANFDAQRQSFSRATVVDPEENR